MSALFDKLDDIEKERVRMAVVTDAASRRKAMIAVAFALVIGATITCVFVAVGGIDETSTQVVLAFFLIPIAVVVAAMVVRSLKNNVVFARAGTSLNPAERKELVAQLARDPAVRALVTSEVKAFSADAVREVGSAALRAGKHARG